MNSKSSIIVFCLLTIIYIAAATMISDDDSSGGSGRDDDEKKSDKVREEKEEKGDLTPGGTNEVGDDSKKQRIDFGVNREEEEEIEEGEGEDINGDQDEREEEDEEVEDEEGEGEQEEEEEEVKMFGVSIEEIMKFQNGVDENGEIMINEEEDDSKIPMILEVIMGRIKDMDGFQTEGIFRINGNMKDVEDLANNGFDPYSEDIDQYQVHTWASLLKKWIRDLPEPLIPDNIYNQLIEALPSSSGSNKKSQDTQPIICNNNNEDSLIPSEKLTSLLESIQPTVIYNVIESLGLFFAQMLDPENISITKIDLNSLSTIMTPTLFKPKIQISQENLPEIMKIQQNEKQIFKSILNHYIKEYNSNKEEDQINQDQEVEVDES